MRRQRELDGSWLDHFVSLGVDCESPIIYFKWVGLTTLAAALRRRAYMDRGMYTLYPNMYVILVAPPGITRKSTAADFGYVRIASRVQQIRGFCGRITPEKFLRKLQNVEIEQEQGGTALTENGSLYVYASELNNLVKGGTKNALSLLDLFTGLYGSGDVFTYDTVTHGELELRNVYINFLACTTPNDIRELIGRSGVESGFTSRTIFIYQDSGSPRSWVELSDEQKELIETLRRDLIRITQLRGQFQVPAEVKRWFDGWYQGNYYTCPVPELVHYWTRRHDQLLKIAMLISVSKRSDLTVTVQDMEEAKVLLEEAEKRMHEAFSSIDQTNESLLRDALLQFLKSNKKAVKHSSLLRKFQHRIRSAKELKEALQDLSEAGLIKIDRILNTNGLEYSIKESLKE